MYRNYDGTTANAMPSVYDRTLTTSAAPLWKGREPDVIVVNLGTNDFSKGDPGAPFDNAYERFVQQLRTVHPDAQLFCAVGPMLTDTALARLRNTAGTVVDALKVAGDTRIDVIEFPSQLPTELGCDYHPNTSKHRTMGEQLAAVFRTELGW